MTDALFLAPVAGTAVGDLVRVDGDEGHHAVTVRRIRPGEQVLLADGHGHGVRGVVEHISRAEMAVRVTEVVREPERAHRWTAVQALTKGTRAGLAIEAVTELGVDEVLAWPAARSVVRWDAKTDVGLAKWRATVREAAKQSRRLAVPAVELATTEQVIERIRRADLALVLDGAAGVPLHAVEVPGGGEVLFIVGPEGGITPEELGRFRQAGAYTVRIARDVLRASTAGVVALAQLQALARV